MGKVDQDNERVTRAIEALERALRRLKDFDGSPSAHRALTSAERLAKEIDTRTKAQVADDVEVWLEAQTVESPNRSLEHAVAFAKLVSGVLPQAVELATVAEAIERYRQGHKTKAVALVLGIKDTAQLRNTRNAAKRRRSKVTRTAA